MWLALMLWYLLDAVLTVFTSALVLLPVVCVIAPFKLYEYTRERRWQRARWMNGYLHLKSATAEDGISDRSLFAVYTLLWNPLAGTRETPIQLNDRLADVYEVDRPCGMSMSELMAKLGHRCQLAMDSAAWQSDPPRTVRGLIRLLASEERAQRPGSPSLLVRAAAPPQSETLLRPAQNVGSHLPDRMVRPCEEELSETASGDINVKNSTA